MMMMLCCGRAASAEQEPGHRSHTPVVHRLAIPEPVILVQIVQVCSQRRPVSPGAEAEMTRANAKM